MASRILSRTTPPGPRTLRGAFIIAVVFSSTALAVGVSQYAFGLFIAPIEETFGWTRTEISASLSFAAVGGLSAPLLGRAMDRFGARPILAISLVVFGLSFCQRPLMTELWHWYALSFMQFAAFSGRHRPESPESSLQIIRGSNPGTDSALAGRAKRRSGTATARGYKAG